MHIAILLAGIFVVFVALRDAFMAILLPRTVARGWRIAARFTANLWKAFSLAIPRMPRGKDGLMARREDALLSIFGPLCLVFMIGVWGFVLMIGFAMITYGAEVPLSSHSASPGDYLYMSGVTFLTLGIGDVIATNAAGRVVTICEAGTGFAFLAIVVSYLPVIYGSFSRREWLIILMDARGGSPPSGGEMLRRFGEAEDWEGLVDWLKRWESWASELLENSLSYPILVFYRSQHSDTSWLCAMTAVMDACSLIEAGVADVSKCSGVRRQARLTYAMSRHAIVDLCQIFFVKPEFGENGRLSEETLDVLWDQLSHLPVEMESREHTVAMLHKMRQRYEPYCLSMSERLRLELPAWVKKPEEIDNWESGILEHHL